MFFIKKDRHIFLVTRLDVKLFLKGRKTTQRIVLFCKIGLLVPTLHITRCFTKRGFCVRKLSRIILSIVRTAFITVF